MIEPREPDGLESVRLTVDGSGRAQLHIEGPAACVTRFHALLRDEAAKLEALGDTAPLEARMARALGVLADRQAALDLSAGYQVTWSGG